MESEFDFARAIPNPYYEQATVPLRVGTQGYDYFENLSDETGISVEVLINSFLLFGASKHVQPVIDDNNDNGDT